MALPHIQNSEAGRNKYDIVNKNCYELVFTLPVPLQAKFGQDTAVITEHVLKVSGLDQLSKAPETDTQKFMGTDRSFLKTKMDQTRAIITVDLSLNLRNAVDNYIYKLFKAWARLGYNLTTGERSLKKDYASAWLKISRANQVGDIYEEIVFKDAILDGGIESGMSDLDYDSADAETISVKFVSDWWTDVDA